MAFYLKLLQLTSSPSPLPPPWPLLLYYLTGGFLTFSTVSFYVPFLSPPIALCTCYIKNHDMLSKLLCDFPGKRFSSLGTFPFYFLLLFQHLALLGPYESLSNICWMKSYNLMNWNGVDLIVGLGFMASGLVPQILTSSIEVKHGRDTWEKEQVIMLKGVFV